MSAQAQPEQPRDIGWNAFVILLVLLAANLALRGPAMAGDSPTYILFADRLRAEHFNLPAVIRGSGVPAAATYSLFVTMLALLRMLGPAWLTGLMIVNMVATAGVGALVTRLVVRITGDRRAGWVAIGMFVLCSDLWQWSRYLVSDATFVLLAYAVFLMEARRLLSGGGRWLPVFAASAAAAVKAAAVSSSVLRRSDSAESVEGSGSASTTGASGSASLRVSIARGSNEG